MDREAKAIMLHCTTLLDTYNADFDDIEENTANYLNEKRITDDRIVSIIMTIMKGCIRYLSVINIVLHNYFATHGKHVRSPDVNIYIVLTYIYLFELDQLKLSFFKKLANILVTNNLYKFLSFAWKLESINTWMKDGWSQVYDEEFVQKQIVKPLLRYMPELQEYVNQLRKKVNNEVLSEKMETQTTVVQPFNLTQPRPRKVPIPALIPTKANANPVPDSMYKEPLEIQILKEKRLLNKSLGRKKLWEVDNLNLKSANTAMSHRVYLKLQEIEEEREKLLQFNMKKAIPLPRFQAPTSIKTTKAAILREAQLHLKKEEAEIRKFEDLESGGLSESQFLNWQTSMKNRDRQELESEVESLRLKAKISHEDAILSKHKLIENNRQLVQNIKQKAENLMQIFFQRQIEEEQQAKKIVLGITQGHKKAKEAKKNIQEYKKKIVEDIQKENQKLMANALEEAEIEMRKRLEVINEIRAMATMPSNRHQKIVDLTQTGNIGLLCEMSLVELKERLTLMKSEEQLKLDQKRDEILASKQASQDLVLDTLDIIFKHRNEQSATRKNQAKEKKPEKLEITDEKVLALKHELEKKKNQRKEKQVATEIKFGSRKLNDTISMLNKIQNEKVRHEQNEVSKEKHAKNKIQHSKLGKEKHSVNFSVTVK